MADLRAADRSRSGVPHPQERARAAADLASEGGARRGAHPGVLPRLRAVEDARAVAEAGRARPQSAHDPGRTGADPELRRGAAAGGRVGARAAHSLCRETGQGSGVAARTPGPAAAGTTADPVEARQNVVPT